VGLLPGIAARIETAGLAPLRLQNRDAGTQADVADADVAKIDEPALVVMTVCTENLIRVDEVMESPKLAE
jgi:hypothetical protein